MNRSTIVVANDNENNLRNEFEDDYIWQRNSSIACMPDLIKSDD